MKESVKSIFDELLARRPELKVCRVEIEKAFEILVRSFRSGGKALVCGNGGSAADAEHICGELLKKFKKPRPLPAEVAARPFLSLP